MRQRDGKRQLAPDECDLNHLGLWKLPRELSQPLGEASNRKTIGSQGFSLNGQHLWAALWWMRFSAVFFFSGYRSRRGETMLVMRLWRPPSILRYLRMAGLHADCSYWGGKNEISIKIHKKFYTFFSLIAVSVIQKNVHSVYTKGTQTQCLSLRPANGEESNKSSRQGIIMHLELLCAC